jgi:hypothetical protein
MIISSVTNLGAQTSVQWRLQCIHAWVTYRMGTALVAEPRKPIRPQMHKIFASVKSSPLLRCHDYTSFSIDLELIAAGFAFFIESPYCVDSQ